jgi:hypothetical protein
MVMSNACDNMVNDQQNIGNINIMKKDFSLINRRRLLYGALLGAALAGCSSSGGNEIIFSIPDNADASINVDAEQFFDVNIDNSSIDIGDAANNAESSPDSKWDAPNINPGDCDTYSAGAYNTPVVFGFAVDPLVKGVNTSAIAAMIYPAYGSHQNNNWVSSDASFSLNAANDPTIKYPAAIVFASRNSVAFTVDSNDLDIYEVDKAKLLQDLANAQCVTNDDKCKEMKQNIEDTTVIDDEILTEWALEYMGAVTMCTFDLPGAYDCIKKDPLMFLNTDKKGSFSAAFVNDTKMFVAVIGCKN